MATASTKTKTKFSLSDLIAFAKTRLFGRLYAVGALAILTGSTVFWSILSAKLQAGNADQLSNVYLFSDSTTFHDSTLPGAHTFLLKWPLFYLIKLFSFSSGAFATFTVLLSLVTVLALAAIIYRIERRPLIVGTIYLALASVLMLVPAFPFAGGLLPLNMAMLTTRNIEYIFYILGLALIVKSKRLLSWQFILSLILLGLLMASDKLFMDFGLAAAFLALLVYALRSYWNLTALSVRWMAGGGIAAASGTILLAVLNAAGVVSISGSSAGAPYGIIQNLHQLALGIFYAVYNLFSNFGANPAFSTSTARQMPRSAIDHLLGVSGFSFIINLLIMLLALAAIYKIFRQSLSSGNKNNTDLAPTAKLSLLLAWSVVAAFLIFIFSNHYYAGDGRYVSIVLFSGFISGAHYLSKKQWRQDLVLLAGVCLVLSILLAIPTTYRTYRNDKNGLASVNDRDSSIAQALSHHPATTLVGDYWRVLPARYDSGNKQKVTPLAGCLEPRGILTSKTWQPDLNKNSFAYLISFDQPLNNDFPKCNLSNIISAYGHPNASALIAGSLSQPKESLLFYDHGIHKSAPATAPVNKSTSTVLPVPLDELPYSSCSVPTVMNVVAHQDDDLLFMNPDLLHDIQQGHCVRTVYVTAGDGGGSKYYWLGREAGSEAAYSNMLGTTDLWVQRIVKLGNNQYVTVANPKGNPKVSLIFMHLPDGNLTGQGFASNHNQSLQQLESGHISTIQAVDGQSSYSSQDLANALTQLMHFYQPTSIRTQADFISKQYPDHSDHMAVGSYTTKAYTAYEEQQYQDQVMIPLRYYVGYPVRQFAANVSDGDLQKKESAFFAYAKYDPGVCHSLSDCSTVMTYSSYLSREYESADENGSSADRP